MRVTQTEKKKVIESLIKVPEKNKRLFWGREIKTLNILLEKYPSDFFWFNLRFPEPLDTMIVFRSGYYADELSKRFKRFNYKIPKKETIQLGEISGENISIKKINKNLKSFLS